MTARSRKAEGLKGGAGEAGAQLERLMEGAADLVTPEDLLQKLERSLREGRPMRAKLGMDPSAPDVHLGHTVVLRKLRALQDLGHEVDLVVGDFTGRIGDPSGLSETRPQLTEEEVRKNAATYARQVFKVLDAGRTRLLYNADWLGRLTFAEVVDLASRHTVARMLERDDFRERYQAGRPLGVHEFLYPLAQAYDSVHLRTDVELGGTDQTFNLLCGRDIMRTYGLEPQVCLMMPLLEGTDGVRKMSKSIGNYIAVEDSPDEMYGKTMSIPDSLLLKYLELLTDVPRPEIERLRRGMEEGSLNPRDAKMRLARELVTTYHGPDAARRAEGAFVRVFQARELPEDIPVRDLARPAMEAAALLVALELAPSRSEARRLVQQGGVRIDGARVEDPAATVELGHERLVQVGKRRFVRVRGAAG